MAAFPDLRPSARSWTAGQRPISTFTSMGGTETRVLHANRATSQGMTLAFSNVSDAVAKQVTDHYEGQMGSFLTFELPSGVMAGWSNGADAKPSANGWRYAGPPQLDFVAPGIVAVSVSLVGVS